MNNGYLNLIPAGTRRDISSGQTLLLDLPTFEAVAERAGEKPEIPILFDGDGMAAGWVTELLPRQDGLYSKIRWSTEGSLAASDREYAWLAPSFGGLVSMGGGQARPTKLEAVTLTNRPTLEGLPPIPRLLEPGPPPVDMATINEALGLIPNARFSSTLDQIARLRARGAKLDRLEAAPSQDQALAVLRGRVAALEAELATARGAGAKPNRPPSPRPLKPRLAGGVVKPRTPGIPAIPGRAALGMRS